MYIQDSPGGAVETETGVEDCRPVKDETATVEEEKEGINRLTHHRGHAHPLQHTHSVQHTHTQDSPGGVVETETGETELLVHGGDVEDAMIAVEGRG